MFRITQGRVSRKLLAFFVPAALMLGTIGAPSLAAAPRKALINESTVSGPSSQEEAVATAAGFAVDVVTDATWGAMTATDFGQYDLLIAGDPLCGILPPGLISSAPVYGPVVLGLAGGRTSAGTGSWSAPIRCCTTVATTRQRTREEQSSAKASPTPAASREQPACTSTRPAQRTTSDSPRRRSRS